MKLSILSLMLLVFVAFTSCESERTDPQALMTNTSIELDDTGDMERTSGCYEFVGTVTRPLTFPVTITWDGGRTTIVVPDAATLAQHDARCRQMTPVVLPECYEFVGRVTRPLSFPVTITWDHGRTTIVIPDARALAVHDLRCRTIMSNAPGSGTRAVRINRRNRAAALGRGR